MVASTKTMLAAMFCMAGLTLAQAQEPVTKANMVKITATETAGRVVDRAMQIHGGMGLTVEVPIEHWFRQARDARVADGINDFFSGFDSEFGSSVFGSIPGLSIGWGLYLTLLGSIAGAIFAIGAAINDNNAAKATALG